MLGCALVFPSVSNAQQTVKNGFVGALNTQGLLTLYKGDPVNGDVLTFPGESFLTVAINGVYYTNNPQIPAGVGSNPPTVYLSFPQTSKVKDTLRSVWKEAGFDIVQNAYPVAFTSSGVIVISIKIVNHGAAPLPVQAQYLLDNENSASNSANDNPYLITRYGYIRNWQEDPPNPIPSFYLAFENPPSSVNLGTVGIGYENDSFPPHPLGLIPLTAIEFGNWPDLVFYPWGQESPTANFSDEAALLVGSPTGATPFAAGFSDSVTEIFRTAYGTPEWCFDHGSIVGFALYPQHITWDPVALTYTPNPFQVDAFLFTDNTGQANGLTIQQTISDPIQIVSPKPVGVPTVQKQTVGSIAAGGVSEVQWIDSVLVSPTGCSTIPPSVSINFDVTASNLTSPIFTNPWSCNIAVDCAHTDTLAPTFRNSFLGCDSIKNDTVTAQDNAQYDLGLQNITYASPDLNGSQYSVTINPPPPYQCISTAPKIVVQQVDTFAAGHVIFTFTDCANNVSNDTLCFTAHPPVPDRTAPRFWNVRYPDSCHSLCQGFILTDSARSDISIDRGLDSIIVFSTVNMLIPNGSGNGGGYYAPGVLVDSLEVCVKDSMKDGIIILRANDTTHNFSFDTITYCTTPDTRPALIPQPTINLTDSSWHVSVTDSGAWDRGVDSVWIENGSNVVTDPSAVPNPIGCLPAFDFRVIILDTTQCASAEVFAKDCAGHITGPVQLTFSKGAIPVISASKTTLCAPSDSAVLSVTGSYTGYLWSNGAASPQITVGPGSYTVTVQEGANCPATSQPVAITFSPATPQITPPGPLAICSPGTEDLDAGAGFASYQWMKDGTDIPGETSEKITVNASGAYSVQVTNAAGCTGASPSVTVTIYPLPTQPVITAVGNVMTSTPAVGYQWSRNGGIINGATNQSYTDLTGGSYTVTITDANGCTSTSLPFSNSGSTLISLSSIIYAQESNQVEIALSVAASQGGAPAGSTGFTAKIAFNKTLLIPEAPPGGSIITTSVGDSLFVIYTGSGSANVPNLLMNLPFTAALGDDSCTVVTIDSFAWNAPNISVTTQNGNFCLTDLCYQGGTRLIDPTGKVSMSEPVPNPSFSDIQIDYSLIEQGHTTLIVYDLLGHEVLRLVDADLKPGKYTVGADISRLPTGTYVYSLRTPSIVKSDHLQISR